MNKRALEEPFLNKFLEKESEYNKILKIVQKDDSLMMCLRGSYVSIYYKGLQILKIEENEKFYIDPNYGINPNNYVTWDKYFNDAKNALDNYGEIEKLEKEVQQFIAKENNCGKKSSQTDYYIFDIEYTQSEYDEGRFDALAFCWPSNNRSSGNNLSLAFIEVKFAQSAICGKSGVFEHYKSAVNFLNSINQNSVEKEAFLADMEKVIKQLKELELLTIWSSSTPGGKNENEITISKLEKPQLIFALANYSPKATCLNKELENIRKFNNENSQIPFELFFATSPCLGYGLYKKCMLSLDEIEKKLIYKD